MAAAFARRPGGRSGRPAAARPSGRTRRGRRGGRCPLGRGDRGRRRVLAGHRPARRLDRRRPGRGARGAPASAGSRWPPTTSPARSTRAARPATVSRAMSSPHPARPALGRRDHPRRCGRARRSGPFRPAAGGVGRAARAGQGRLRRLAARAARPPAREAFCVLLDNGRGRGVEVVVALDGDRLVSAADLPEGVQPAIHIDEFVAVAAAVRADPRYIEAVRARGHRPGGRARRGMVERGVRAAVRRGWPARSRGCAVTTPVTTRTRARCTAWWPWSICTTCGWCGWTTTRRARRRRRARAATTATAAAARIAPMCGRSRSRSPRVRASCSRAAGCGGRAGTSTSGSIPARG